MKMIFRKQSTSGNIIKECSSTEVAVEYLRQITEDNFMEAFNMMIDETNQGQGYGSKIDDSGLT